jgi:phage terminase large subunit
MAATLVHRYEPRGSCKTLLECRAPEILVSGPAGTGKSRGCLEKLHLLCLKYPGMRGVILRKTLTSLGSTALVTWREHVVPEALRAGVLKFYGGSQQEAAAYRYANGSTIVVGGMDRATRIMSSEYDVAYVQEAIELTEADWEAITTRLRNGRMPYQQIIADTNPDTPHHWLNTRVQRGVTLMLDARHEDNPTLVNLDGTHTERGAAYLAKLDALTGVRHSRLRRGLWVAAEGLIYEDWDPAVHLVDRFDIPESWTRYWSIDFGHTNPMVIQCWAEDPDGRLYLYREIYRTKRTVDEHARDILATCTREDPEYVHPQGVERRAHHGRIWTEPKPRAIVADHDADGRAVMQRELGLSTVAAKKAVGPGIQAFEKRLRPAGDGRPRLFILRDSVVEKDPLLVEAKKPTCTAEEIVGYVWDTGAGKAVKEQPLKENDHGCDGGRYLVAYRDLSSRPSVRFM